MGQNPPRKHVSFGVHQHTVTHTVIDCIIDINYTIRYTHHVSYLHIFFLFSPHDYLFSSPKFHQLGFPKWQWWLSLIRTHRMIGFHPLPFYRGFRRVLIPRIGERDSIPRCHSDHSESMFGPDLVLKYFAHLRHSRSTWPISRASCGISTAKWSATAPGSSASHGS